MSGHTPEPWFTFEPTTNNYRAEVRCKSPRGFDKTIARLPRLDHGKSSPEANAARIVACVNFCAGYTNDQLLLSGSLRESVEARKRSADERDDLLAHLRRMMARYCDDESLDNEDDAECRALIARVQP